MSIFVLGLVLAGCDDGVGPSRAIIATAVEELNKLPGEGWVLLPPGSCMPEELRGAAVVDRNLCRPLPGASAPTFLCDVAFRLADGTGKTVEVTMRKDPDFGWSATIDRPLQNRRLFLPCP